MPPFTHELQIIFRQVQTIGIPCSFANLIIRLWPLSYSFPLCLQDQNNREILYNLVTFSFQLTH